MYHQAVFTIPAIRNVVPEKVKPWIIVFIVIIIQFSGGIYMATANEMIGVTSLMHEDVMLASYASLIGLSLYFGIMFRFKMRFASKFTLLLCSTVLIVCNLICLKTNNPVVLVTACFFAGFFKMWATFECNSTIQLWMTPKRDMSVFFCFVILLVQSSILLSGITNLYVALFSNWEYMHYLIIGALLLVVLLTLLLFNNSHPPLFPLKGIDWTGALLWGLIVLGIDFICIYGDYYDWWASSEIVLATIAVLVMLALNLWRASFVRHPYIPLETFRFKPFKMAFILFILINILLAPSHLIEEIYFEGILHYDATHLISVNWMGWAGAIIGAFFTWRYFAVHKRSYKSTFLIGFSSIVLYLIMMYFQIDYQMTKSMLVAPIFFRNFGYVICSIVILTNMTKIPFPKFPQSIGAQSLVGAGFSGALGVAILKQLFKVVTTKNFQLISSNIDGVNHHAQGIPNLESMVQQQVMMVSFKELYGMLVISGIACLTIFLLYYYPYTPNKVIYPRMRTIRQLLRKEVSEVEE
jgi:MFS transporter, DHA2 family, multidrug resistance protein